MKKCENCVVNASCTKKEYEGTLCQDVMEIVTKKIDSLREEANRLEKLYGLEGYYHGKMTEGMTVEQLMELSNHQEVMKSWAK